MRKLLTFSLVAALLFAGWRLLSPFAPPLPGYRGLSATAELPSWQEARLTMQRWADDVKNRLMGIDYDQTRTNVVDGLKNGVDRVKEAIDDPEQVKQQLTQRLNKIVDNVEAVNDQLLIQGRDPRELLAKHFGGRHLPRPSDAETSSRTQKTPAGIQVLAGDNGVPDSIVRQAAETVQTLSLPIVQAKLGQAPSNQAVVVLYSTKNAYRKALTGAGVDADLITPIVENTNGICIGTDVWLPLYSLQDKSSLANVLTHELTHVVFNEQGLGTKLPTWVNEGVAWDAGMTAMKKVNPAMARRMASSLNSQLGRAAKEGRILPLAASEEDILRADYNVEWQDYQAVDDLIKKYGEDRLRAFLTGARRSGVAASFQAQYGMSITRFEREFAAAL
ncbi:hypothetical protein GTO89_06500 [Heliobacterium gestii]|uniref:Peptidase MA-like domain-containing protein n=1 Tax=Heliomicrobium gestii TaxID=2699 RepID=A0A845L905_HELGE|nr:hypothetical protein [Heliomicrobium gestii]MBM7865979.1 hypothetical protein [Heliomicrobium gestii]MZP42688.1 hypothetical protein [Heliomicrobium gestii]